MTLPSIQRETAPTSEEFAGPFGVLEWVMALSLYSVRPPLTLKMNWAPLHLAAGHSLMPQMCNACPSARSAASCTASPSVGWA
jgi:hypothetical protein